MSRTVCLSVLPALVFAAALLAPRPAQAVPFILSDAEAGYVCDFSMAGAVIYYRAHGNTYLYTCDGNSWVISGML